nr:methyl-accepting chemotaxis protein [Halomonas sp. UBA3074]
MNTLLNRLPMYAKFSLVLALPLLALAWFAINGVLDRQATVRELKQLQTMTALAQSAGDLIHQIQIERGMSSGYLASGGEAFGQRLSQQRPQTDTAAEAFIEQRRSLAVGVLSTAANEQLDQLERQWQRTASLRREIDQLSIEVNAALSHYTVINQQLMGLIGSLAQQTREGEISRQLAAYFNLLHAKDLAGIERAILSAAFGADGMSFEMLNRYLTLIGEEAAFLTGFRAFAGADQRRQLTDALSGQEIERLIERRELAIQQYDVGGYNVDPNEWFEWQTVKISRLKNLEDNVSQQVITTTAALQRDAQLALWRFMIIAVLATLFAVAAAAMIVLTLTRPLTAALKNISTRGNDLTQRLTVPGTDELSKLYHAFNDASQDTEALIGEIKRNAQSVELASGEIAQGNQDLAQRTEEQSASLVQTASSLEEITATVRQTADNAHEAQRMTHDVATEAEGAAAIAQQAQQAMQNIHSSSDQITTIIAAIDNIAFQTNLLALNASVEAARAGEHGRGFAVVASEVRKLASRSAEEASQIRQLIENNIATINEGEELVTSTNNSLTTISERVQKVARLMEEMASATHEQSAGVEQINRAMSQLEEVTQQNAALVEEVAAASRSLDEQAEEMSARISKYKVADSLSNTARGSKQSGNTLSVDKQHIS